MILAGKKARAKATITDVAGRAGVSIKTVSRVVNNEPNVRASTRDKVLRAAKALRYQPNPSARGLAGNKSFSLGLLYEAPHEFSYVKNALDGVFRTCQTEGYSLLMRPCNEDLKIDDVHQFLMQTRVDGVILTAPIGDNTGVTHLLTELEVPFAQIAPKKTHPDWTSVQCNDADACYGMTEYLLSLGHRRIGFIKGHPDHGATMNRLAGYKRCLKAYGVAFDRRLVRQGYFDFESGKSCAYKLLECEPRPTAIFASNDDMAAGVIFAAHDLGLSVPRDVSIAGFDDTPTASHTWPPLTTIKQPIVEMASQATRMLIHKLRGAEDTDHEEVFDCNLIVRSSTAACLD